MILQDEANKNKLEDVRLQCQFIEDVRQLKIYWKKQTASFC